MSTSSKVYSDLEPDPAGYPRIWVIEEDGTHSPGYLVNRHSGWPGSCRVQRSGSAASFLWARRNVIDHETGMSLA
jgi:hypothetical protein